MFRLRHRNGDYVCCRKIPAESSGHVQWRDNVVVPPIPFSAFLFLPLTCSRSSPFVSSFKSRLFVFPARIQSVRSKRKERVHKDHMPPRLRLQGKRSCSLFRFWARCLSSAFGSPACPLALSKSAWKWEERLPRTTPKRGRKVCTLNVCYTCTRAHDTHERESKRKRKREGERD